MVTKRYIGLIILLLVLVVGCERDEIVGETGANPDEGLDYFDDFRDSKNISSATFINMSGHMSVFEDFESETSNRWVCSNRSGCDTNGISECVCYMTTGNDDDYYILQATASWQGFGSDTGSVNSLNVTAPEITLSNISIFNISAQWSWDHNLGSGHSSNAISALYATDGNSIIELLSHTTNGGSGSLGVTIHGFRNFTDGTWAIWENNTRKEANISFASLSEPVSLMWYTYADGTAGGSPGSGHAIARWRIYNINTSGIRLKRRNGTYDTNAFGDSNMIVNMTSNITRVLLKAQDYAPVDTKLTYAITINNSHYFNVSKDTYYYFSGIGTTLYWRLYMNTSDNMTSPFIVSMNITVEPYDCATNSECPIVQFCNNDGNCIPDLPYKGNCYSVQSVSNHSQRHEACLTGDCAIEVTDDYDGDDEYSLCRASNISSCIHDDMLFETYIESGGYTCSINSTNVGNWSKCITNSVCDNGYYCNQNQTCDLDILHGVNCSNDVVFNNSQLNSSCNGTQLCYQNSSTDYWCNSPPDTYATNLLINDSFIGLNYRVVNWTAGSDPDGDTLSYFVEVGSSINSSNIGTGWTVNNNTEINLTSLTLIQTYHFNVLVCDIYGWCMNYSQPINGNTTRNNSRPNPPTIPIPLNDSSSLLPVVFSWTTGIDIESGEDSGYDSDRDYFCIQSELNYTHPCINSTSNQSKSIADNNEISLDDPPLRENVTYYWAMRTDDGFLNSSWVIWLVRSNTTDINVELSSGVTEILFYPNTSNAQRVEPECQTSTFGCINVTNRRGYAINISMSVNMTYPVNYREGDSNWNFEHNGSIGNNSLWSVAGATISLVNRSINGITNWAMNITY